MNNDNAKSIVWFRQNLRLEDNAALAAAVARGGPVIPVFIVTPEYEHAPGSASRWWLDRSLRSLAGRLEEEGSRLITRVGNAGYVLSKLVEETGATAVFMSRTYEPGTARNDERVMASLALRGIEVFSFNDSLLFDPDEIRNRTGDPYRVFTPFWNRLLMMSDPGKRTPKPARIPAPVRWPDSTEIGALCLVGRQDDTGQLARHWSPGEPHAMKAFDRFRRESIISYGEGRDHPGGDHTSRMSPHLHFGEISPRRMWYEVRASGVFGEDPQNNLYLRQLAWREFGHYLLRYFPESIHTPLREKFASFPWRHDQGGLEAWKSGRTGYPLVDAGMRELSATGWMHNRVRMVTASFLVKNLMIHWLEGANWFLEKLVDADLANNTLGWQWTAGCGVDAAPYFRVFNPVLQGIRFDSHGRYIRKWLPELETLPNRYVHSPWTAPGSVLAAAGIQIGHEYPGPIVDHDFARARALHAYRSLGQAHLRDGISAGGR